MYDYYLLVKVRHKPENKGKTVKIRDDFLLQLFTLILLPDCRCNRACPAGSTSDFFNILKRIWIASVLPWDQFAMYALKFIFHLSFLKYSSYNIYYTVTMFKVCTYAQDVSQNNRAETRSLRLRLEQIFLSCCML